MAGHVFVDPSVEYASQRRSATPAGFNGTGSSWWPLAPGTCIDYDVYPVKVSWDNAATNAMGITSRCETDAAAHLRLHTGLPAVRYGAMPMEQYEQPPGTARGFLTEGGSVDVAGQPSIGESGTSRRTRALFLARFPRELHSTGGPVLAQRNNGLSPECVCGQQGPSHHDKRLVDLAGHLDGQMGNVGGHDAHGPPRERVRAVQLRLREGQGHGQLLVLRGQHHGPCFFSQLHTELFGY